MPEKEDVPVTVPEEAAPVTVPEEAAQKEEAKIGFPPLDKVAKCFYDTESKAMWVGLPVGFVDPFFAAVYLDASKLEFFKHSQREMPGIIEAEKRRQSLVSKVQDGVGSMMARLGGKAGH